MRTIELLESDWEQDDSPLAIPEIEEIIGYTTDVRTVNGSITSIENEILIVETGGSQELYIPLKDHPDLKWTFIVGDVVSAAECCSQIV